jgi:hypothetical protein
MKKFFAILALALLAVSGTGYAVTCAYDNVPAATLLVPYWRVSLNGATGAPIPGVAGATDTLVSIVNVSTPGVIAHVTVWNKYSKAVLDFNVPLTGKDVASFSMKDVMNGKLNVNPNTQVNVTKDACGINLTNNTYLPSIGWGQTSYIRFSHPESSTPNSDAYVSISIYAADAFAVFRNKVWSSLDESGDISTFTNSKGANILDTDNPGCWGGSGGTYTGNLSGYLTIDVVNFCTNYFPADRQFYNEDAIATAGWSPTYTPNVLIGDVFYIDAASNAGNISGDPAVALEFDSRLTYASGAPTKTFFGRYLPAAVTACAAEGAGGCSNGVAPLFQFGGDGREPLGDRYGFRYLADSANQLQTWILVWREDRFLDGTVNLCTWADPANNAGAKGDGFYDADHVISALVYDNDENFFTQPGQGGPSGNQNPTPSQLYIFLESQRINLLAATDWNPGAYKGGWVDVTLRSASANPVNVQYNQGWIGVQHTAPGAFVSVGHAVANLNNQFQCSPAITFGNGNTP